MSKRKQWNGRIYLGRDERGKQWFHWVGRYRTKAERTDALAHERARLREAGCDCPACVAAGRFPVPPGAGGRTLPTCDEYVDRYLAEYERRHKRSSYDTQRQRLQRFREDFEGRPLDVDRAAAKDWVNGEGSWSHRDPVPAGYVPSVVTLYNHAIDEDDLPIPRNPFRKLGRRTKGRSEEPPPTVEEFQALLDACSALGDYASQMRAFINFSAFTLMRPGELYPLELTDIDFEAMRIRKERRLYRGELAEPKTGPKTIALTPPARDAILGLPRDRRLVFVSKTGKQLSQSTLSGYWGQVLARANLAFDFYHATKHYGVHYMWTKLDMSRRAIAAQAGWEVATVDKMLRIYGHGDVGALDEVDAAFERAEVVPLRTVAGGKA